MQNLPTLQPAPYRPGYVNQYFVAAQPSAAHDTQGEKKKKRHRHTDKEWEEQKELLAQLLYKHTVEEAARIIKETQGFEAGVRQYKTKIAHWGLGQHNKASDLKWAATKQEKRKREAGLETVFIVGNTQLEDEQLERFKRRNQDQASPSEPTPQGVEYYTPHGVAGLTPGNNNSPPGWGPLSRAPTFQEILHNSKNNEIFSAQIMEYDRCAEPVTIVEVREQLYGHRDVDEQPLKHEFHQGGRSAAVGRGRFSKRQKATQLLWQASNMASAMQAHLHEPQSLQYRTSFSHQQVDEQVPQFWICSRSDEVLKSSVQRIIGFVKHNVVFRNILGLTRPDNAKWVNDWVQMPSSEGPLVESVANYLFGDPLLSYPEMSILNILVKFRTTSPIVKPVLLRVSLGQDPRTDVLDCHHCAKTFHVIDYIGPQGAAKLHMSSRYVPQQSSSHSHQYRDWADFRSDHATESRTIHTKWSQIAYLYQGWSHNPLFRPCTCENKVHKNVKSGHFINLWDEKTCKEENDIFDGTGDLHKGIMGTFEPYPQESSGVVIEDSCGLVGDSEEEDRWDPEGDRGREDVKEFEPFPPAEHGEKFLSPAVHLY